MPRLTRSLLAVPLAAALSVALTAAPASAAVDRIDLVTGSLPEGITAGPEGTVFAGARSDGSVYQYDTADGRLVATIDREAPLAAVGMEYDERSGLLWVAGGGPAANRGTGTVTAYRDGAVAFEQVVDGAGFLNDLTVTREAVYVTDSFDDGLVVVPLDAAGLPSGEVDRLPLSGDWVQPAQFGANGIRPLPDGDLVVVNSGDLYAVDPVTGVADRLAERGRPLTAGDGLEIDGRTLYVVNGFGGNEVAVLKLNGAYTSAKSVGVLTDPELDRPTTGALVDDGLYVVNGRFGTLQSDPDAEVYVTRLALR